MISVSTGLSHRPVDAIIQVPTRTSLNLNAINDGDIRVDQVQGELEVSCLNGAVTLTQVSGSAIAHALNGDVKVTFASIDPNKSMSFSSLNGDIDVTFPASFKANDVIIADDTST